MESHTPMIPREDWYTFSELFTASAECFYQNRIKQYMLYSAVLAMAIVYIKNVRDLEVCTKKGSKSSAEKLVKGHVQLDSQIYTSSELL